MPAGHWLPSARVLDAVEMSDQRWRYIATNVRHTSNRSLVVGLRPFPFALQTFGLAA